MFLKMFYRDGFVDFYYNIKLFEILLIIFAIKYILKFCNKGETKYIEEKNAKKCIFHIPMYIEANGKSGSKVRPMKMLQALKNIGYEVDVVMGYGAERKQQIVNIKNNIKNGIKYDFVYSEDSTMPTLLTEKNHFPRYPFLDFGFMKYCKKNGIKIGLYYRDVYWRFPFYKKSVNFFKRYFAYIMYYYDFYKYYKLVDVLYTQSEQMQSYLPRVSKKMKLDVLPPGGEQDSKLLTRKEEHFKNNSNDFISVFYVGGIGNLYNLENLLSVVSKKDYIGLTICCREDEWELEKSRYEKYLNPRISIVHASGKDLEKYYKDADLCSIYFPPEEYRDFVMPIKLFEYVGHVTPILATAKTATGDFVEKNKIGWAIENDEELDRILEQIHQNKEILLEKYYNLVNILPKNTWEERARKVVDDLKFKQQ